MPGHAAGLLKVLLVEGWRELHFVESLFERVLDDIFWDLRPRIQSLGLHAVGGNQLFVVRESRLRDQGVYALIVCMVRVQGLSITFSASVLGAFPPCEAFHISIALRRMTKQGMWEWALGTTSTPAPSTQRLGPSCLSVFAM